MDFSLENPLADSREFLFDTIPSDLFLIESDHLPSKILREIIDFDESFRREAVSSVLRVSEKKCKAQPAHFFASLTFYISVLEHSISCGDFFRFLATSIHPCPILLLITLTGSYQATEFL